MEALKTALQLLQQNNFKITKQRQYLINYLYQQADFYISLSQLDQKMRLLFPKMSHNTIYRNVKEMQEIGILETKMFANGLRVKFQCDFNKREHSHFICQQCGRALEISLPDFSAVNKTLESCQINQYHVEVWGVCSHCHKKTTANV